MRSARNGTHRLLCAMLSWLLLAAMAACGKQQAALPDMSALGEISVISREDGSGTRSEFESLTGTSGSGIDRISLTTQEVLELVAEDENAIGYVALSAVGANASVKLLSIDGVVPEESSVRSGKYPLCRSYFLAYMGKLSDAETDFLAYVLSAGQELIAQTCIPVKTSSTFLSDGSAGIITICGSSSAAPLLELLAEDYKTYNPNVEIQIQVTDSTSGLTTAIRGECSFAMSSRSLKDYEAELLEAKAFASDGVAVIVNTKSPLESLTMQQLKGIYDGSFTFWRDIK